jgi:hypothetical protein
MPEEEDVHGSRPAGVPECTFAEFFEAKSANVIFRIVDAIPRATKGGPSPVGLPMPRSESFFAPAIRLWCDSEECDGVRTFDPEENDHRFYIAESDEKPRERFITFRCRNCRRAAKTYAILYAYEKDRQTIDATKLGEIPPLSQRIPSRLRTLVGTDQEKFDKGLRSEAHGLGVGAFAYYRQSKATEVDRQPRNGGRSGQRGKRTSWPSVPERSCRLRIDKTTSVPPKPDLFPGPSHRDPGISPTLSLRCP